MRIAALMLVVVMAGCAGMSKKSADPMTRIEETLGVMKAQVMKPEMNDSTMKLVGEVEALLPQAKTASAQTLASAPDKDAKVKEVEGQLDYVGRSLKKATAALKDKDQEIALECLNAATDGVDGAKKVFAAKK